ncbi:MAG: hypothetical protein QF438_07750 [Phycisphaerales bacterium]|jgi:hypothetical protein|nr:hypothetical protein [Phycisphaerales bacterium]HCA38636.1 hypothetical protein [Phycisphaerales bacterium]
MAIFGTTMVLVAIFDACWGLIIIAVGEQVQTVAQHLSDNEFNMMVGSVVHSVTLGIFSLSGVETGEHARDLLAMLPRPDYLVEVGWSRVVFSATAFLLGIMLVARVRGAMVGALVWAIVVLLWASWVMYRIWPVTSGGFGDLIQGEGVPMSAVELTLHFLWPIVLASRVVISIARRESAAWR